MYGQQISSHIYNQLIWVILIIVNQWDVGNISPTIKCGRTASSSPQKQMQVQIQYEYKYKCKYKYRYKYTGLVSPKIDTSVQCSMLYCIALYCVWKKEALTVKFFIYICPLLHILGCNINSFLHMSYHFYRAIKKCYVLYCACLCVGKRGVHSYGNFSFKRVYTCAHWSTRSSLTYFSPVS